MPYTEFVETRQVSCQRLQTDGFYILGQPLDALNNAPCDRFIQPRKFLRGFLQDTDMVVGHHSKPSR